MKTLKKILTAGLTLLLVAAFLMAGGTKLMGAEIHLANFATWGFPVWFMYLVGVSEVTGALALLTRQVQNASLGLMGVMGGAIATHTVHSEFGALLPPILLFGLLAVLRWVREPEGA